METKMIGSKIADARKKLNVSQAQLAQQLFISPQAVGKWERGESIPDIITLDRLAKILGVDLNYFSESFSTGGTNGDRSASEKQNVLAGESGTSARKSLNWDMSHGNWLDVDFSGLKNLQEKFSASNIQRCLFVGSNLSGLLLNSNNVSDCDFSNSDITNSHIQRSHLTNNIFRDCSLNEVEFLKSYIEGGDFTSADFTGVEFKSGAFGNNKIANVVWSRTSFIGSQLADLVFEGKIDGCFFESCTFTRVTFQRATLVNTFFKNNKKLKHIRFIDCQADKLTYAFLKSGRADLSGVMLMGE
jgi:transcriptional regulator with XRE-family HTH domain